MIDYKTITDNHLIDIYLCILSRNGMDGRACDMWWFKNKNPALKRYGNENSRTLTNSTNA